jgi:hypothetical protein
MKKLEGTQRVFGYLLLEEQHECLQKIRDQLLLMAMLSFAVTEEEEAKAPLELRRSMLGQCFEAFGLQLEEVLYAVEQAGHVSHGVMRKH